MSRVDQWPNSNKKYKLDLGGWEWLMPSNILKCISKAFQWLLLYTKFDRRQRHSFDIHRRSEKQKDNFILAPSSRPRCIFARMPKEQMELFPCWNSETFASNQNMIFWGNLISFYLPISIKAKMLLALSTLGTSEETMFHALKLTRTQYVVV